jgi:hypothetical protein
MKDPKTSKHKQYRSKANVAENIQISVAAVEENVRKESPLSVTNGVAACNSMQGAKLLRGA